MTATKEPNLNEWLKEARESSNAHQCGMFLSHVGVVRKSPKAQVREGDHSKGEVDYIEFSYNAKGLQEAINEAKTWPGVYYLNVWLNEGRLAIGDAIMYVIIGADIRPNAIDAFQNLVGKIKTELVKEEEFYID